ncbi:hypothetical protein BDF22DRAFT_732629 [Syncephalis plumigaleata]|nr:hypothetical protein BDF22DRAFT_732629 [Syncephalis plumigaleata]
MGQALSRLQRHTPVAVTATPATPAAAAAAAPSSSSPIASSPDNGSTGNVYKTQERPLVQESTSEQDQLSSSDTTEVVSDDRHEDDDSTEREANQDDTGSESDSSGESLIEFLNQNAARNNDSSATDATVSRTALALLQQDDRQASGTPTSDSSRRGRRESDDVMQREQRPWKFWRGISDKMKRNDRRRTGPWGISDLSKASCIPVTFEGDVPQNPLLQPPSPRTSETFITFVDHLAQKRSSQIEKLRRTSTSNASVSSNLSDLSAEGIYQMSLNPNVPLKMSDTLDIDSARVTHILYHYVLHGDYIAPVRNPSRILDVAPREGSWIRCMANAFPKCEVVGCGITNYIHNTCTKLPKNCTYVTYNFDGPMPFSDNSFDYIHQRSIATFLTTSAWNDLLTDIYRVLRPGGYIELVERDMLPSNVGLCTAQLTQQVGEVMRERGMDVNMARRLDVALELHGFEEVHKIDVDVPVGAWGGVHGHLMGWLTSSTISMAQHALVHGILWQLTGGGTPTTILDRMCGEFFPKPFGYPNEDASPGNEGPLTENEFMLWRKRYARS